MISFRLMDTERNLDLYQLQVIAMQIALTFIPLYTLLQLIRFPLSYKTHNQSALFTLCASSLLYAYYTFYMHKILFFYLFTIFCCNSLYFFIIGQETLCGNVTWIHLSNMVRRSLETFYLSFVCPFSRDVYHLGLIDILLQNYCTPTQLAISLALHYNSSTESQSPLTIINQLNTLMCR